MPQPTKSFTAAQIAAALGIKRQAVQWHLRDVPADGVQIVAGNTAHAWTIKCLPAQLRERLEAVAVQQRCRTAADLMERPREAWQPAIPMGELAAECLDVANKLHEALRGSLQRQNNMNVTAAILAAGGVEDYRRVFGNAVSARHWRRLFDRTIERDNGAEDWNRLEIYLPERLRKKDAPAAIPDALKTEFGGIEDYISACGNPRQPNQKEREGIWTLALEKVAALVAACESEKSAARRVRQFLFARASFLAVSRDALLKAFNRKLEAYQAAGRDAKALRDGREENGACFALPEDDRDLLIHRAVFHYRGDIAPAWRDLLRKGFSQEVQERYAGRAVKKSHVPASVMEDVSAEVEYMTVLQQGPRAFDAIKGHVTRSYDGISALQCIQADDFTLNTYFYIPAGNGKFTLTRGQVILFIDVRSFRILGWALEPRKSYSSLTIRSLCTHIFAEFGLPEVLYFERGIWKSATLLKGKTDPHDFTEISQGLKEFGIKFMHAVRPRSKVVERIGGMFQDIAEAEPGYCGRDERHDAPESLRKEMAQVETGKCHPSKFFYSLEQWNERIKELVDVYNEAPQQGHVLGGLSPDQAFQVFTPKDNPPMQLPPELRYLLAHDKRVARVTLNGITIQIGKQKFNYRGKEIAHLVNRDVLAWFNPEAPEIVTVTDLDRKNAICVSLSESPNALECIIDPGSGALARELSRIEGQASFIKTRYNVVKAKFPLPRRQLLADAQTRHLGEQIAEQKAEITETAGRRQRQQRRAQQLSRETGIAVSSDAAAQEGFDESARTLREFLGETSEDKS